MSLLVARMITPLIAAYFLRSHGQQPHADFRWMHAYLRVLRWSLDTSKAQAYRLSRPGFAGKVLSLFRDHRLYMVGAGIAALLLVAAFLVWWGAAVREAWRDGGSRVVRAATIASAAMLGHSLVDFPLRTTAMAAVFAFCVALMARRHCAPAQSNGNAEPESRAARHVVID
jgi:multidrug efflux pump subunit AcrB